MEIDQLISIRKELHCNPELSGKELNTSLRIETLIKQTNPTKIIDQLGGHGIAAVYQFAEEGPCVMLRCELDALPIQEVNTFGYQSGLAGVSHKCGHDGHMAILIGVANAIQKIKNLKGNLVLLFQPAEETGQGGKAVLEDEKFEEIKPDYVFALHNIPGYPKGEILLTPDYFSATVQSCSIKLKGLESHASEPEKGINPARAIANIVLKSEGLNVKNPENSEFSIVTTVYQELGSKSYGISAGYGEVHFTLRCWSVERMDVLVQRLSEIVSGIAGAENLEYEMDWFEYFPGSPNHSACRSILEEVIEKHKFSHRQLEFPFRFGEDFGWFAQQFPAMMFGLGAGEKCLPLHNPGYDFPDEVLGDGVEVFVKLIETILG